MTYKLENDQVGKGLLPGSRHARRGLTMIETALATIIVGLSVLSIVKLVTVVVGQNMVAQKTTTALTLANNVREYMNGLPFNDPATGTHRGIAAGTPLSQYNDVEDFCGNVADTCRNVS